MPSITSITVRDTKLLPFVHQEIVPTGPIIKPTLWQRITNTIPEQATETVVREKPIFVNEVQNFGVKNLWLENVCVKDEFMELILQKAVNLKSLTMIESKYTQKLTIDVALGLLTRHVNHV